MLLLSVFLLKYYLNETFSQILIDRQQANLYMLRFIFSQKLQIADEKPSMCR